MASSGSKDAQGLGSWLWERVSSNPYSKAAQALRTKKYPYKQPQPSSSDNPQSATEPTPKRKFKRYGPKRPSKGRR